MNDMAKNGLVFFVGAMLGAAVSAEIRERRARASRRLPTNAATNTVVEPTIEDARALVARCLSGALQAAQLFVGDRLGLYATIQENAGNTSALALAAATGLSARWLREWLAQQAAMGVLELEDGEGDGDDALIYRLPPAFATVLADTSSPDYDVSMIQAVPSLIARAKQLPEVFQHGIGQPYNDADISQAIDRSHTIHTKHVFIPKVLPMVAHGKALAALTSGVRCADLGCGSGCLLLTLAPLFPLSQFHGFEISEVALVQAQAALEASGLTNLHFHDARLPNATLDALGPFKVILTYDVLHDATRPEELIAMVKEALAPGGLWLLGDINCADSVRGNLASAKRPMAATYYSISMCLCMSSALSEPGGAGLGTLGFGTSLARKMLGEAGFSHVEVLLEHKSVRWFEVAPSSGGILEEYADSATFF